MPVIPAAGTAPAGPPAPPPVRSSTAVDAALEALAGGRLVAVADHPTRECEVDLVLAAEHATAEVLATMIRYGTGIICAAMTGDDLDRLALPPMTAINEDVKQTAYGLTCDAAAGVTTGVSAADRARTLRVLADPVSNGSDLRRPGHMFTLRAQPKGVLVRGGHTEAAVDLMHAARLFPAAAIVELIQDDGTMVRPSDWRHYARRHNLTGIPFLAMEELIAWRRGRDLTPVQVFRVAEATMRTQYGLFTMSIWIDRISGEEYRALTSAVPVEGPTPVRVHSACHTGDALGSLRCDCGPQLAEAMRRLGEYGGVLIYVPGHEGRGIGLPNKIRAYALQDQGFDTVDANTELGLPVDARSFEVAGQVLAALGVTTVALMTNNGDKVLGLGHHVQIAARVPLLVPPNPHSASYLATKRDRMDHHMPAEIPTAAPARASR